MPAGNRGLFRFSGPSRPGLYPWDTRIHGRGTLALRPAASPATLGFYYFATDVSGGTLYQCILSSGSPAWSAIATGAASSVTDGVVPRGSSGLLVDSTSTDDGTTVTHTKRTADTVYSTVAVVNAGSTVDPGNRTFMAVSADADGSTGNVQGIAGGADGRCLYVYNESTTLSVNLLHEAGAVTATDRIAGANGSTSTLPPQTGAFLFYYSSRWRIIWIHLFDAPGAAGGYLRSNNTTSWKRSALLSSDLSGTIAAGLLPTMVAAGGSHAAGALGDPGATAHSNHPYYWGDDAAWHIIKGYVLGKATVATSQTTTSASAVGLATALTFNVTIDVACDLIVLCSCNSSINTATNTTRLYCEENTSGGTVATVLGAVTIAASSGQGSMAGCLLLSAVPAGTYTFTQKYSVGGGVTGTFYQRYMEVRVG